MKNKLVHSTEKGQSLVELALMLVFILVLLAGVVDLGRMMYEYLTMRDAAQEGAGYGSIFPGYCNEIAARVMDNLPDANYSVSVAVNGLSCSAAYSADAAQAALNKNPINGCAGKTLLIDVNHNFAVTMPLLGTFIGNNVPMHVGIDDRIVRPACQ